MLIQLKRIAYTAQGTFGVLLQDGEPFAVTAEEIWRGNKQNISCIPPGRYFCTLARYKNKYDTYLVQDVPGRTGIYFHLGNSIRDTEGCILVAERFEHLQNNYAVWHSKEGFNEFMNRIDNVESFMLEILDYG